jgi:hypothetical protein
VTDELKKRRNAAVLWALLFALCSLGANAAVFATPPMQSALPWLSLTLAILAMATLVRGLWLAFGQAHIYRGKVLNIVLGLVTLALSGMMIFTFFLARKLPGTIAAPQIGQRVPDFTLTDANGQSVSLDSLFTPASGDPQSAAPKAVLLIFYRGYW